MATLVASKRVVTQLGMSLAASEGFAASKVQSSLNTVSSSLLPLTKPIHWRHISQLANSNGKRLFLVDTLALVIYLTHLCWDCPLDSSSFFHLDDNLCIESL